MIKHLKNGTENPKPERDTHELAAVSAAAAKKPRGNVIGNVERLAYAARARKAADAAKSPRSGSAAPKPKRTAAKRPAHLSLRKIEEIGAMVLDPERLLAAIDHAEHAEHDAAGAGARAGAGAGNDAGEAKALPAILGDVGSAGVTAEDATGDRVTPVPPSGARPADDGTPKPPPLRENERAVATHTGVIIIRRWRAA